MLNQLDLYPAEATAATDVMFANFGEAESMAAMAMMKELRKAGIKSEIYPDAAKMKKQMGYADSRGIPFVAIVGENEMAEGKMMLKDMRDGSQALLIPAEAITIISKKQLF